MDSKIKIIHFSVANTAGGVTRFILNIIENIDKEKFQCDVVTFAKDLDYADELKRQGVRIYYLTAYAEDDFEEFTRQVEVVLENGYDIMHLHTSNWRSLALEEIGKRLGIKKVIIHSHNTDVHIKENADREAARRLHYSVRDQLSEDTATDFLACSLAAADWLYGSQISKERIKIIPNAIDTTKFAFDESIREKVRAELGIEGKFVIGHVGRFAYQKNHEFLIDVFRKVQSQIQDAVLLLIGIGEKEQEIKKKVNDLGLTDKVFFLGRRDDTNRLYQAMDVFAFPSRFEGFGIVLAEAQVSSLYCVVSDAVTTETKLSDEICYLPLEKDQWVNQIYDVYASHYKRETNDRVKDEGFDVRTQIKMIEEIYRSGLNDESKTNG